MEPLFIVSQPRSGSTLLQGVLSNNELVATASEPWFLLPLLSIYEPQWQTNYNHSLALRAVDDFLKKQNAEDIFNESIRQCAMNLYNGFATKQSRYFLDKTPRYYLILSSIRKVFPKAKIIILKRHPFAVLDSILRTSKADNDFFKLYHHRIDILKGMHYLESFVKKSVDDENVKVVRYEDYITNPISQTNMLYDWLNIPFTEEVLNYGKNSKFHGLFGDQVGIRKSIKPENRNVKPWEKRLDNDYWINFFKGYGRFLGEDFLRDYGNYEGVGFKKTKEFDYFNYVAEHELLNKKLTAQELSENGICENFFIEQPSQDKQA